MKKLLFISAFVACIVGLKAQTVPPTPTVIAFAKTEHSFGKIKKDKPVTYVFSFINNGKKPLLVENATAECGCTTPVYDKAAILKGKKSTIKVSFNAQAEGVFNKKVTVKFLNIAQPVILNIKGEVIK